MIFSFKIMYIGDELDTFFGEKEIFHKNELNNLYLNTVQMEKDGNNIFCTIYNLNDLFSLKNKSGDEKIMELLDMYACGADGLIINRSKNIFDKNPDIELVLNYFNKEKSENNIIVITNDFKLGLECVVEYFINISEK